jgi:hypothetical protein
LKVISDIDVKVARLLYRLQRGLFSEAGELQLQALNLQRRRSKNFKRGKT